MWQTVFIPLKFTMATAVKDSLKSIYMFPICPLSFLNSTTLLDPHSYPVKLIFLVHLTEAKPAFIIFNAMNVERDQVAILISLKYKYLCLFHRLKIQVPKGLLCTKRPNTRLMHLITFRRFQEMSLHNKPLSTNSLINTTRQLNFLSSLW